MFNLPRLGGTKTKTKPMSKRKTVRPGVREISPLSMEKLWWKSMTAVRLT